MAVIAVLQAMTVQSPEIGQGALTVEHLGQFRRVAGQPLRTAQFSSSPTTARSKRKAAYETAFLAAASLGAAGPPGCLFCPFMIRSRMFCSGTDAGRNS